MAMAITGLVDHPRGARSESTNVIVMIDLNHVKDSQRWARIYLLPENKDGQKEVNELTNTRSVQWIAENRQTLDALFSGYYFNAIPGVASTRLSCFLRENVTWPPDERSVPLDMRGPRSPEEPLLWSFVEDHLITAETGYDGPELAFRRFLAFGGQVLLETLAPTPNTAALRGFARIATNDDPQGTDLGRLLSQCSPFYAAQDPIDQMAFLHALHAKRGWFHFLDQAIHPTHGYAWSPRDSTADALTDAAVRYWS